MKVPDEEGYRFADNFESWTEACERRSAVWRHKRHVFIAETLGAAVGAFFLIWLFSR